jgi:soluble P-type ATPase
MNEKGANLIKIDIPGWGNMEIENILLDLNGTIATNGKIPLDVREKINLLSEKVTIYILTADTQGTAEEEVRGMNADMIKIAEEDSKNRKFEFLKTFDFEKTVAIGNGNNDQLILKEAALGIAVLGDEGMSVSALKDADIVVKDISNALDLFLKPKRLIATLRE